MCAGRLCACASSDLCTYIQSYYTLTYCCCYTYEKFCIEIKIDKNIYINTFYTK